MLIKLFGCAGGHLIQSAKCQLLCLEKEQQCSYCNAFHLLIISSDFDTYKVLVFNGKWKGSCVSPCSLS